MSAHLKIFTDVHWTGIGLLIFFILFLFFIASTFTPTQKRIYAELERLPLEKSDKEQGHV